VRVRGAGLVLVACVGAAICLAAVRTPVAHADAVTFTVVDATGNSDPVVTIARTTRISGETDGPRRIWIRDRPADGSPCAATPASDPGAALGLYGQYFSQPGTFTDDFVQGDYHVPGPYLFCTWFTATDQDDSAAVPPLSQVIVFRALSGSSTVTATPTSSADGAPTALTLTGSSDIQVYVRATYRPAGGAPCAATSATDTGTGFIDSLTGGEGPFAYAATIPFSTGTWLICTWLDHYDGGTFSGPQATQITVGTPPATPMAPRAVPKAMRVATQIRAVLPARAHHLRLSVSAHVTATRSARGACALEVERGSTWHAIKAHAVTARGTCAFTAPVAEGRRRYRVEFRPATGFAGSVGAARWVRVTKT
jgi:hypothetical protein